MQKPKGPGFPKTFLTITMPTWVKCDSPLTATKVYKEKYVQPLPVQGDVYVGSPWETGKTYTLEHITVPERVNVLMLFTRHTFSNAVSKHLNLVSYQDIEGDINLPDHKRVVCQIESLHWIRNNCKCDSSKKM